MSESEDFEALLAANLPIVERIAASVCRRFGVARQHEVWRFDAWVKWRLALDDHAMLRKFRGLCSISTYLAAVVTNLFREYRRDRWGRGR